MSLKHTISILFLSCTVLGSLSAQNELLHPQAAVNLLRPEKTIFKKDIQTPETETTVDLVRQAVRHFEVDQHKTIALLSNGDYLTKVNGKGVFVQKADKDRLNRIIKDSIERLEIRYAPNYLVDSVPEIFWGTINMVWTLPPQNIEELLGEEYDPITQRLLEQVAPLKRDRNRIVASSITRAAMFVGVYSVGTRLFFGAQLEVPLSNRFSIHGDVLMNLLNFSKFIEDPSGKTQLADYRYRSFESRALLVGYINKKYPRFYCNAGPYTELGRQRRIATEQIPELVQRGKLIVGVKFGAGVQLSGGLYFQASISSPMTSDGIAENNEYNSTILTLGYRFGRP